MKYEQTALKKKHMHTLNYILNNMSMLTSSISQDSNSLLRYKHKHSVLIDQKIVGISSMSLYSNSLLRYKCKY